MNLSKPSLLGGGKGSKGGLGAFRSGICEGRSWRGILWENSYTSTRINPIMSVLGWRENMKRFSTTAGKDNSRL